MTPTTHYWPCHAAPPPAPQPSAAASEEGGGDAKPPPGRWWRRWLRVERAGEAAPPLLPPPSAPHSAAMPVRRLVAVWLLAEVSGGPWCGASYPRCCGSAAVGASRTSRAAEGGSSPSPSQCPPASALEHGHTRPSARQGLRRGRVAAVAAKARMSSASGPALLLRDREGGDGGCELRRGHEALPPPPLQPRCSITTGGWYWLTLPKQRRGVLLLLPLGGAPPRQGGRGRGGRCRT